MDNKPKDFMFVYNNINNVFDAIKRSTNRIPSAKIISENIETYTIEMKIGGGLFSKSDNITITLEKLDDLQTKVYFDDHAKKGSLAKKNKNIEKLKLVIDSLLPKVKMDVASPNDTVNNNNQMDNNVINNGMVNTSPIMEQSNMIEQGNVQSVIPTQETVINSPIPDPVINNNPPVVENNQIVATTIVEANNQEVTNQVSNNNDLAQSKQKENSDVDPLSEFMSKM